MGTGSGCDRSTHKMVERKNRARSTVTWFYLHIPPEKMNITGEHVWQSKTNRDSEQNSEEHQRAWDRQRKRPFQRDNGK